MCAEVPLWYQATFWISWSSSWSSAFSYRCSWLPYCTSGKCWMYTFCYFCSINIKGLSFIYHCLKKLEPKAQMVLLANPTSSTSGRSYPSESPDSHSCDSSIDRKNIHLHPSETHGTSDILMTPKLLGSDSNSGIKVIKPEGIQVGGTAAVPLSTVHQAVILAKCLLIEKSARHDYLQSKFPW